MSLSHIASTETLNLYDLNPIQNFPARCTDAFKSDIDACTAEEISLNGHVDRENGSGICSLECIEALSTATDKIKSECGTIRADRDTLIGLFFSRKAVGYLCPSIQEGEDTFTTELGGSSGTSSTSTREGEEEEKQEDDTVEDEDEDAQDPKERESVSEEEETNDNEAQEQPEEGEEATEQGEDTEEDDSEVLDQETESQQDTNTDSQAEGEDDGDSNVDESETTEPTAEANSDDDGNPFASSEDGSNDSSSLASPSHITPAPALLWISLLCMAFALFASLGEVWK